MLTGFMGVGKSIAGRESAGMLGLPFVDTDELIEERLGLTVAAAFEQLGEEHFRKVEAQVVRDVLSGPDAVIALGGGTLLDRDSRAMAEGVGLIVTLTCSPEEIERRLQHDETRPLIGDGEPRERSSRIRRLLDERAEVYGPYPQVSTEERTPRAVAEDLTVLFKAFLDGDRGEGLELDLGVRVRTSVRFGALKSLVARPPCSQLLGSEANIVLICDTTVAGLHLETIREALGCRAPVIEILLPPGERMKTLDTVAGIYRRLQATGIDRLSVVVGAGGGVVTDVAGFVAATYLRGLRLVLVPTTLLAQVDAAIGGKTGVDLGAAKNAVGAFHPAEMVLIDPALLCTLSSGALADGLAEMIKIAVVWDAGMLAELEGLVEPRDILGRPDLIRRAAAAKVEVVRQDPREMGVRTLLNFGHTTGHALEAATGYSVSHGQAIAVGMVVATALAIDLDVCEPELLGRLQSLLFRLGLPGLLPPVDQGLVMELMRHDKKRQAGQTRMVLPVAAGSAVVRFVDEGNIASTLDRWLTKL